MAEESAAQDWKTQQKVREKIGEILAETAVLLTSAVTGQDPNSFNKLIVPKVDDNGKLSIRVNYSPDPARMKYDPPVDVVLARFLKILTRAKGRGASTDLPPIYITEKPTSSFGMSPIDEMDLEPVMKGGKKSLDPRDPAETWDRLNLLFRSRIASERERFYSLTADIYLDTSPDGKRKVDPNLSLLRAMLMNEELFHAGFFDKNSDAAKALAGVDWMLPMDKVGLSEDGDGRKRRVRQVLSERRVTLANWALPGTGNPAFAGTLPTQDMIDSAAKRLGIPAELLPAPLKAEEIKERLIADALATKILEKAMQALGKIGVKSEEVLPVLAGIIAQLAGDDFNGKKALENTAAALGLKIGGVSQAPQGHRLASKEIGVGRDGQE